MQLGLTYPGIGFVVWRSKDDLPEDLIFHVNYLGGDMPTNPPFELDNRAKRSVVVDLTTDAGLALFDYDKSRDYRIFIPGADRKIYLYNIEGNIIPGWNERS